MSRRTNRLSVERLENRELMAGDVNAVLVNGVLFINEAQGQSGHANHVTVSELPSGLIRVKGRTDTSGDLTLVNGAAYKDFLPFVNLAASLGNGHDTLSIVGPKFLKSINVDMSVPGATDSDEVSIFGGTQTIGEVRIRTGGGPDIVFVQDIRIGDGFGAAEHLTIDTGTGQDLVSLAGGVLTKEGVTILTGEGDDTVFVRGTDVGDGRGFRTENLRVDTGAGRDSVIFGAHGERVLVRGNLLVAMSLGLEAEVDTVRMSNTTVHKSLSLLTGSGDDRVAMDAITATRMVLSMGDGNDTAELVDRVRAGDMFIGMGNGNDVLDLTGVGANFLNADGGAGVDRLFTFLPGSVSSSIVINWELINPPWLNFELPPGVKGNP